MHVPEGARLTTSDSRPNSAGGPRWLGALEQRWDRLEGWFAQRRRADAAAIFFLTLFTLLIAVKISVVDTWLTRVDLLTAYLPFYAFLGEQLRSFNLPGWSPFQASGLPFAGDPQSGWMYAPAMVWFAILPPVAAFKAMAATQILIAALATYAFARVLGLGVVASLGGAISFAFGSNVYHNTACCTIWAQGAPWIPVSLLGVELGLKSTSLRHRVGGWAIAGFGISQLFAGWIGQGAYNGLLIIGAYTFYRAVISPPGAGWSFKVRLSRLLMSGAVILLLGLGLAAAGVLPRFETSRHSPISGTAYEVVEHHDEDSGWKPVHLLDRMFDTDTKPNSLERGDNRRFYVGAFTMSLALVAGFTARRRYATPLFVFVTAVMLILTLQETLLHRAFYLLPVFRTLHEHTPFRILGLFYVFPAILAAIAIHTLRDWARHRWLLPIAFIPPLVVFSVDAFISNSERAVSASTLISSVIVAIVLLMVVAIARGSSRIGERRSRRLMTLMTVMLLIGIVWSPFARQFLQIDREQEIANAEETAAIETALAETDPGGAGEFLQEQLRLSDMPFRYFGYDGAFLRTDTRWVSETTYHGRVDELDVQALLVSARASRLGLYDVQGYNPAQYEPYVAYLLEMNAGVVQDYHDANVLRSGLISPLLDLLSVRFIVVPYEVPPGRPDLLRLSQQYPTVFSNGQVRVLKNPRALPHAWLVRQTQVGDLAELNRLLQRGEIDPREIAFVDEPILGLNGLPADDTNRIIFDRYDPDAIDLTVNSETGGLLIVSELVAPGWQAYVNGEAVDTHTVNGILRGVVVPAGTSVVTFRYELRSLRIGLAISAVSALAMLGIGLWNLLPWWRKRRESLLEA